MTQENPSNTAPPPHAAVTLLHRFVSQKTTFIITAAICLVLIIGSSVIGAANRTGLRYDQIRVKDFTAIQSNIMNYFRNNNYVLPQNIDALRSYTDTTGQRFSNLTRTGERTASYEDPETGRPYEYKILSPYSYQLCTTFSTEKTTPQSNRPTYSYSYYPSTDHIKGYDCLTYQIPEYYKKNYNSYYNRLPVRAVTPTPTHQLTPHALTFLNPKSGDTLCIGQPYTIEWETNTNATEVQLSLTSQQEFKMYLITKPQPTTQQLYTYELNNRNKASFNWTVGSVMELNSDEKITTPPGNYRIQATITQNDSSKTFLGEQITLADCSTTPTMYILR
jgi:hypothetical protein